MASSVFGPGQEVRYQDTAGTVIVGAIVTVGGAPLPSTEALTFSPDNTWDIGSADAGVTLLRPRTVYVGTSVVVGGATAGAQIINGPAATSRLQIFRTAGANRWSAGANATAEGGADAGSDWSLRAFTDVGNLIDAPILVTRAAARAITIAAGRPLVSDIFQTSTASPAASGVVRLAKTDTIAFRNNVNGADVTLSLTANDQPSVRRLFINSDGAAAVTSGLCFVTQTNQAAGNAGTLTNARAVGNPTLWLPINVNGVKKAIPCW